MGWYQLGAKDIVLKVSDPRLAGESQLRFVCIAGESLLNRNAPRNTHTGDSHSALGVWERGPQNTQEGSEIWRRGRETRPASSPVTQGQSTLPLGTLCRWNKISPVKGVSWQVNALDSVFSPVVPKSRPGHQGCLPCGCWTVGSAAPRGRLLCLQLPEHQVPASNLLQTLALESSPHPWPLCQGISPSGKDYTKHNFFSNVISSPTSSSLTK